MWPDVQALRKRVAPLGCSVTTSLLFREPVAQYVSFYRYYIQVSEPYHTRTHIRRMRQRLRETRW